MRLSSFDRSTMEILSEPGGYPAGVPESGTSVSFDRD
jgi:hypothetical protein